MSTKLAAVLLFLPIVFALPGPSARAHENAFVVNGVPVPKGSIVDIPVIGTWRIEKHATKDLYLHFFVSPPVPPAPPKGFRVQDATKRIISIGGNLDGPPVQKGKEVLIKYKGGETATIIGTLLLPGQPNPPDPGPMKGVVTGPADELAPDEARVAILELLAQPDMSELFPVPIDLSYFHFDFFGTTPFPVFAGEVTFTTDTGLSSTFFVIPEPGTLALGAAATLAWLAQRRRRR
ncbi:hypothetical protein RugamoR64_05260 [Duganella rhizosphaerae]|uniref:hypothetical protein n=1 Tax=Duganella rhizosphaerae TaxID=2885763 RepID=UPI0030EAF6AD